MVYLLEEPEQQELDDVAEVAEHQSATEKKVSHLTLKDADTKKDARSVGGGSKRLNDHTGNKTMPPESSHRHRVKRWKNG